MPSNSPMSSPENKIAPESQKGFNFNRFKLDKNSILIIIAVLAVLVAGALIIANSGSGNVFSFFTSGSKETVAKKAIDYLNNNILQPGQKAELGEVSLKSGVIKLQIKIGGNNYDSYVTRDATLLFPQAYEITSDVNKSADNSGGSVRVSVDDDPALGNKDAPITMIEFSDYECPFCKRHFLQTYPEIKKNYIDTGKVKLIFRDFVAVQGHKPLAVSEAMAAECAREQGGDNVYFKYHDELFKRTASNGNGLDLTQLAVIAKDLKLNVASLQSCLDSQKYKEEFNKDNADALSYLPKNNAGTPSFFIGKSSADGMIEGMLIRGAQDYAAFQAVIDELLK